MYFYLVEHLGSRVVFNTVADAETYIELMDFNDEYASIKPCLVGWNHE